MKENIKWEFIRRFVLGRDDVVMLDSAILTKPETLRASGHIDNFTDPLVECKVCHKRFRQDQIGEIKSEIRNPKSETNSNIQIQNESFLCEGDKEHNFTDPKNFNLMFSTKLGSTEDSYEVAYLRPETAQGMFTNFANVLDSTRRKLPFGIAQIGKSFRNEITTGNFNFRSREFELAEIEYFVKEGKDDELFSFWISEWERFIYSLGIKEGALHRIDHKKEKLAHYSKATTDLEYDFPFGRSELAGIANRTDFDLKAHKKASGKSLEYFDSESNKKYIPYVIEPTLGIDRLFLALLCDAIEIFPMGRITSQIQNANLKNPMPTGRQENDNSKFKIEADGEGNQVEIVLHLNPKIAPIQVAVLPLSKKPELTEPVKKIAQDLRKEFANWRMVEYDETGSIGKRYRRQDEIGTPLCITYDFESNNDQKVTVRNRDTMEQDRIKIADLSNYLKSELENWN